MLQGRSNVIEFIRLNETPYWYLRRSEKTEPIFTSGDGKITIDESIARLNKCFDMLSNGSYFIEAWATEDQKKMRNKDSFVITGQAVDVISGFPQAQTISALPGEDVQAKINTALDSYKKELKIEQLEARVKELEAKNKELELNSNTPLDRIAGRLEPYMQPILNGIFGTNQNTAVVSGGAIGEVEATERLEKAFDKWMKKEPDPLPLIEKIAELSATDEATYNMAKNMLLSR